jgi:membrane dipeptidase
MVDVSHISKQAMLDAVRLSAAPVIASHSSVRALCDVPRNMDDEQLRALKDNGGVIQMVALDAYVKETPQKKRTAIDSIRQEVGLTSFAAWRNFSEEEKEAYRSKVAELDKKWPRANVSDFVDHIDYAVNLIGIEHVGISSDFDGGGGIDGWEDASETYNVTIELVRRGYSEDEIRQIWGGNLLRVWRQVDEISQKLQNMAAIN